MVKKVKLVRIAQGYPTYKFAVLVGVHPNWWREIEMGTREPSVAHFGAVSSAAESLPSNRVPAYSKINGNCQNVNPDCKDVYTQYQS